MLIYKNEEKYIKSTKEKLNTIIYISTVEHLHLKLEIAKLMLKANRENREIKKGRR